MRYGNIPTTAAETHCIPTMSNLKTSLKRQKEVMEDFVQFTKQVDMNWELRQQTIGSMYLEIRAIKEEIHRLKQRKKLKVKKGK